MSIFLNALALAGLALAFGVCVVRVVASLPETVLFASANGGRYAGLGSSGRSASVSPSDGARIRPVVTPHGTPA